MPLINHTTGTNTNDATATASDILSPKTAYVKGELITGEIETKDETDLQVSGSNIILPAGYYKEQAGKSVATTSHSDPTISFDTSTGKITASHTQTEGYVTAGTTTAEQTLTTKSSSDLTTNGATITAPAGYYPTVVSKSVITATQAIPSISISSTGKITASATQTAGYVDAGTKSGTKQMTTKAATTWTPKTSNQTIASGTYLTGTQTIMGDSNLKAENIKSGVSIFGVNGTLEQGGTAYGPITSSTHTTTKLVFKGLEGEPKMIMGAIYNFSIPTASVPAYTIYILSLSYAPSLNVYLTGYGGYHGGGYMFIGGGTLSTINYSYSNGTVTLTSTSGNYLFAANTWALYYTV